MKRYRFVIVGSGWRSLYFVRIAKALPETFQMCAMLCRTQEKADRMAAENDIYTTTSIEECREMQPDFVVVAVNKASIAEVSKEWMNYGFTVLCETPAALDVQTLNELWSMHNNGGCLVVSEQYRYYPVYEAQLSVLKRGIIGSSQYLNISLAHEYHGASLMRAFLDIDLSVPFSVAGRTYTFPTVETKNRYEIITDGRIADKKRTVATFEFADGKVAVYDFDSEQYRSPIRNNYVKLQGIRGEMKDNAFYYLDDNNLPVESQLVVKEVWSERQSDNPNLRSLCQIEEVRLVHNGGENELIYSAPWGLCGLTKDETAIARIMIETAEYDRDRATQDLRCALQDAYMAILMKQAVDTGEKVNSEAQSWY